MWDAHMRDTLPCVSAWDLWPIFKVSPKIWIIAARCYISKNHIYFSWHQYHLLCLYKLNCNRKTEHATIVHLRFSVWTAAGYIPSWRNIPSWVWLGLTIDIESYDAEFDTTVILGTEFHDFFFISHQTSTNITEKIFSTINVIYAPLQINWARNIAYKYFSQQPPASSFTTVSNVMVLLCELRHQ